MEWKSATRSANGAVSVPERWLHLHYYEAFNILFRAENALRVFTYTVLKNEFKEKWADISIQTGEDSQSTIAATAAKRMAQAKGFGYLCYDTNSPLMYLNSGELTRLITSNAYWKLFEPHFRGKRDIITNKLEEISVIRNSLAHFRPIKQDDIEVIKQNVKHAFLGIEQSLLAMMGTNRAVPTNTDTDWYKSLIALRTPLCSTALYQNTNKRWMRLALQYKSATLRSSPAGNNRFFVLTKLASPAALLEHPKLTRHCIFASERTNRSSITRDSTPTFTKTLSLTFSIATVERSHDEIVGATQDLLMQIENETELVQSDNLARGVLIDVATIRAASLGDDEASDSLHPNMGPMKSEIAENSPTEYWADLLSSTDDFIAGTTKYPWMPAEISKEEFPF